MIRFTLVFSFQAFKQYLGAKSGNSISSEKGGRFGTQLRGRGGTDSTQSSTRRKRSISITKGKISNYVTKYMLASFIFFKVKEQI